MKNLLKRYVFRESMDLVRVLRAIAESEGKSPVTVALSWLLKDKAVTSVIAGARTVKQLEASMDAGDWDLPDADYLKLKEQLPRDHGYPHEWMNVALVPSFSLVEPESGRPQRFPPVVE